MGLQGHSFTCQVPHTAVGSPGEPPLWGAGVAGVRAGGASASHPGTDAPAFPRPCWKCPVLSRHSGFLGPWDRGSGSPAVPGYPGLGSVVCPGLPCQGGNVLRGMCMY